MLFLFFTSSAFYRYLSLARQVPGAPARAVTDRQTDTQTHDDYYNLAPSRARLITCQYHKTQLFYRWLRVDWKWVLQLEAILCIPSELKLVVSRKQKALDC